MQKHKAGSTIESKTFWRKSLPFKFSLIQLLVAFILICSTLWFALSIQKDQLLMQQQKMNESYGQLIVSRLHEVTAQIESLVISMANVGKLYRYDQTGLINTLPNILDLESQRNVIVSGGIWPEPAAFNKHRIQDSLFWARNSENKLVQNHDYNSLNVPRYHLEDWYRPLRFFPSGKTLWSKAYTDPYTRESMVTASVPMWMEHEFIGVATVDISLYGISQRLRDEEIAMKGYVITLDSQNRIISFPSQEHNINGIGTNQFALMDFGVLSQQFPAYSELNKALNTADAKFIQQSKEHQQYSNEEMQLLASDINADKRDLVGAIYSNSASSWPVSAQLLVQFEQVSDPWLQEPVLVSVFLMPNTFWKIITVTPISSLKHQAQHLTKKVGIYLIVMQLLALILLFFVQYRLFLTPITRIVSALKNNNAAKLELDASHRQDEIGVLAQAFISRTQQLEIAMASLDAGNVALEQQLHVQQLAQQDLKRYKEQLSALLKCSESLIYIKDLNGKYILVNDRFCEILGIEKRLIINANDNELFPTSLAKLYRDNDKRVIDGDTTMSFEEPVPTLQGDVFFLVTKFLIKDDDDQTVALGAMAFDMSIKKQLEQQYHQLEQHYLTEKVSHASVVGQLNEQICDLKDQLVASKEHNICLQQLNEGQLRQDKLMQNMLTLFIADMMASTDKLLMDHCRFDASVQPHLLTLLDKITEQADKLRLLHQLFGYHNNEAQAVNLKHFLEKILSFFKEQLNSNDIRVNIKCKEHLVIDINPWFCMLLFYRLINNTIHHAFKPHQLDRVISIEIDRTPAHWHFIIDDNGAGLSQDLLDKLHEVINKGISGGTLSTMSVWVKQVLHGQVEISSSQAQGTRILCKVPLKSS